MPIRSFRDERTRMLMEGRTPPGLPASIARRAAVKLLLIDSVTVVEDLRVPPGNRLHRLGGDRKDQWSISVNDRWRISFIWREGDAHDVEFVDYH